jgi:Predicted membrane protein/domain
MNCTQCGAPLSAGARFCQACGKDSGGAGDADGFETRTPPARDARYGGFWRRVAASVIDGFVLAGLSILLVVVGTAALMMSSDPEGAATRYGVVYYIASYVAAWLYFAFTHSGTHQASLGKRALGIKVTDLEGRRISFARATGRYFAYLVTSIVTLCIGLLMAAFTRRRQALHDIIAGTLVVSRASEPEDVARGLEPPKVSGAVIAIAAIAGLAVPVAGILAAIAIPAYQDYTVRAQVLEGLEMASEFKAAVADAYANGARFEDMDNEGLGLTSAYGPYVGDVSVQAGVVVITYGAGANPPLSGRVLLLVPGATTEGEVLWACGHAEPPEGVVEFALEDHDAYTDVEPKYLPVSCRG